MGHSCLSALLLLAEVSLRMEQYLHVGFQLKPAVNKQIALTCGATLRIDRKPEIDY